MMQNLFQAAVIALSSILLSGGQREKLLRRLFGHEIHPSARIGLNFIAVKKLVMKEGTVIGHLNFIRGLSELIMHEESLIGRFNWITALPIEEPNFFKSVENRDPSFEIGRASVVMNRMIIDCNNKVSIGEFGGFAGHRTVVMTHGVDIRENVQTAGTIEIGDRTMIATNCVILGGTKIPEWSVVGAGSVVRGNYTEPGLYSGVPAKRVADLPQDAKFFTRDTMIIY
jgi:acetyltransferase-like isoleucine patch superfamily enzyme